MPAKPMMRSSESANSTISSTWLPNAIRSGKTKKAATASTQGSASKMPKRWRVARNTRARSRASRPTAAVTSLAAIEPRRLDEQDQHRDRIDDEAAGACVDVLAGGVAHAEQDRGGERALEAAEAADRDHQQEEHEIKHREARGEPEQVDGEAAAERREPAADREGEGEQPVDIDADRLRDAAVVDGGADFCPDIGALEGVPQGRGERGA